MQEEAAGPGGRATVRAASPAPRASNRPLPNLQGWSPERSQRLGGDLLDAVLAVAPTLR
jgi:hypothetical protein